MSGSTPISDDRIETLFFQAVDIKAGKDRATFLAEMCEGDEQLRSHVEKLLTNSEAAEELLDPDRYDRLNEERDALVQELAEEGQFLHELGDRISQLGDDYHLLEELGRGTAGVVFRARQVSLNREVAVKILLGSVLASPAERERFQVEAKAAAALKHPNIVPVYEIGHQGKHDFYTMALLSGGTLGTRMTSERIDRRDAVQLMLKVARTMQAAHQRGIIHRDLKPDNLLLDEGGEPYISDFGLACRLEQQSTLTLSGQIMGTPQYMAPEQMESGSSLVTTAADVYSMGVILYELLTGVPPIHGASVLQTLQMIKDTPPRSMRTHDATIDRDLETIVMKCLEKDLSQRYDSAKAFADDLEAWQQHRPIAARPPSPGERVRKWVRRRPVHAALLVTAALLVSALGIGGPIWAIREAQLRQNVDQALVETRAAKLAAEQSSERAVEAARLAQKESQANRRLAYASNMRLIATTEALGQQGSLAPQAMLASWRPQGAERDMRDWAWYYLYGKTHLDQLELHHQGPVHAVSFSPYGESFIVSGAHGTTMYNTLNRMMSRRMQDGQAHRYSAWSPDGETITTLSAPGIVTFWNAKTAKPIALLPNNRSFVSISWGPSGRRLATLDASGRIGMWRVNEKPERLAEHTHRMGQLHRIAWSPNGLHLAAIGDSKDVFVWSIKHLDDSPEIYQGHSAAVTTLAWQHDSAWLATGSRDNTLRVWGVPGGVRVARMLQREDDGPIRSLAWNPDGLVILNTTEDREDILELSLPTGEQKVLKRFPKPITVMAWNAEAHSVVAANAEGRVFVFRKGVPPHQQTLLQKDRGLISIAWSEDGAWLYCVDEEGTVASCHSVTNQQKSTTLRLGDTHDLLRRHAWSSDGRLALAVVSKRELRIFHPRISDREKSFDLGRMKASSVAWSNQSKQVLVGGKHGDVVGLTLRGGRTVKKTYALPSDSTDKPYRTISSSPDDRFILATGDSGRVVLWSRASDAIVFEFRSEDRDRSERKHAWHPESTFFATANKRGIVSIWSVENKKKLLEFQGHQGVVSALAWHPDGRLLATGGQLGSINIWDWKNGEHILALETKAQFVTDLAWGPDGRRLASTDPNGRLMVWDATAGYLLSRTTEEDE